MANMSCSRRIRGSVNIASGCGRRKNCCDWVHNGRTAKAARRVVRRKERVMWRKDQGI